MYKFRFMISAVVLWAAAACLRAAPVAPIQVLNVGMTMRDGVRLSANVFRPGIPGRYPTLLIRTPYDKGVEMTPNYQAYIEHGYAVVVQDVRGRYASAGRFDPINQEIYDGDDTITWVARQLWSDGQVGMVGGSYVGIAQWKAGLAHNPHLKAIFPYVSGDDDYMDRFYSRGGAMKLGHRLLWVAENLRAPGFEMPEFKKYVLQLPVRKADFAAAGQRVAMWQLVSDHPDYDAFWKQTSVRERLKDFDTPVYSVGGWYDNYVESDLDAFTTLTRLKKSARILVGPWAHSMLTPFDHVSFGKDSIVPLRTEQFEFFDKWMKGRQPSEPPAPVRIFVMGANRWREEWEWPLARAKEAKFFLASAGRANTLDGDGELVRKGEKRNPKSVDNVPDTFTFDPKNPTPTMGGAVCCEQKVFPSGPMDQRAVERRRDVLVYSTAPLSQDVEVTGTVKLVLFVSSTAVDTDFTAKLVDVFPNGEARNLTDGILRMRYRESLETPKLMKPGDVYKVSVDAGVTSNVFLAGHRIRLEVSSSNFPRFDRNPNSGRAIADETQLRPADQTVYHDMPRRSYLSLPVVPSAEPQLTSSKATRYVANKALLPAKSGKPLK